MVAVPQSPPEEDPLLPASGRIQGGLVSWVQRVLVTRCFLERSTINETGRGRQYVGGDPMIVFPARPAPRR